MNTKFLCWIMRAALCVALLLAFACESVDIVIDGPENTENTENPENQENTGDEDDGNSSLPDEGKDDEGKSDENEEDKDDTTDPDVTPTPEPDRSVERWDGEWALDMASDVVGSSNDFYYELNTFATRVEVTYANSSASVSCDNGDVVSHVDGAYVTLDLSKVSGVEVVVSGTTADGGLKIYSDNKYKLLLNGSDIRSQRGPAINSQSKKRVFVHLAEGTTNRLRDCAVYGEDSYTLPGVYNEDRKGAFFAEGNIIMSGYGALVVEGEYKHAIVTDGCYYQRPGVTVAITKTAKNGIHAKGDSDDGTGVVIAGGMLIANVSSVAGKGIKCDGDVVVSGGELRITTSGDATYDSESSDTSSSAAIKSDATTRIEAGVLRLSSSGTGGKGISTDGALIVDGGQIEITTSGGQYKYSSQLTSSPKGIRADGDITINGGSINIQVTGKSEGSEGLESKGTLTFNGGEVVIKAYDDAINAAKAINMNGGKVYAHATNNDGIDTNGTLTINGGLMIGVGTTDPEGGIDVDNTTSFKVNGGTAIGLGGTMMGKPSTASTQCSVVYGGVSASVGRKIALLDASGNVLIVFEAPIQMNSSTLFFTTPELLTGSSYTISADGTLSNYADWWQCWYSGGEWTAATELTSFTVSSVVTSIGSSGGPGGGGGGGGGDWPGGGGGWPGRP